MENDLVKELGLLMFAKKTDKQRNLNNIKFAMSGTNRTLRQAFYFVAEPQFALLSQKTTHKEQKEIMRELFNVIKYILESEIK